MKNVELARGFYDMAALLEVKRESVFRVRAYQRAARTRAPFAQARQVAEQVAAALRAHGGVEQLEVAGSLRRLKDTVRDVDLLAASREPRRVTDALRAQIRRIRALQPRHRIRILAGTECDILADGAMDFPDELLRELDIVLAAVHSRFKQSRAEMTARIVRALEHPHVDVLAHPTGRRLGTREPYDVDLEAVFAAARARGKAVEINASPERLDLADRHARRAAELGIPIAIDTDTHHLSNLDNLALGVAVARRAWIAPSQVLNARPASELLGWARRRRSA